MGESVTIKVKLDIEQTKRELAAEREKTSISTKEMEAFFKRVAHKGKGWTGAQEDTKEWLQFQRSLDPESRKKVSQRAFDRLANRKSLDETEGEFSLTPSGLSKASGLNQLTPKNLLGDDMNSAVMSGIKGGATLYAGLRIGNTIGVGLLEALKGAIPGVEALPGFDAVQKQVEGIAKAMDDFENRILGIVKAAMTTYEVGKAGANLSGGQPIEYSVYADQEYQISVAEGNLDRAFDRFKNKQMARSFGTLFAEASKRLSQ